MRVADFDQVLAEGSSLEEIRRTAEQRLLQIQPLIEEAKRLRDVLELLERNAQTSSSAKAPPAGGVREPAPRAAKGANKRTILDLVGRTPGITASEISHATGMKRTVVASTLSRLKRQGELRDHERGGVCLPGDGPSKPPSAQRRGSGAPKRASRRRRVVSRT